MYPLLRINQGVDIEDTGYNLVNFLFFDRLEGTWLFATYLANVLGAFFIKLPFGDTMLGMNFYTGLIVSASALAAYCFFIRLMPYWIAFLGGIAAISLCWAPTAALYHYLTYALFLAGTLFLLIGLKKEKRLYYILAGIFLGMNVLVRFPNITETALILLVWYAAYLKKKKLVTVCQDTGFCLLGYLIGIGSVLLYIVCRYGLAAYTDMISGLFSMSNASATDYQISAMIISILKQYVISAKWLLVFAVYGVLCICLFAVKNDKCVMLKKIIVSAGALFVLRLCYAKGMFNVKYYTYESMFQWAALFLWFSLIICIWKIFQKQTSINDKLLAAAVLIIIIITPLGTNNHIYTNINNMFFVFPVVLYFFVELLINMPRSIAVFRNEGDGSRKRRFCKEISSFPVKMLLLLTISVTIFQSVCFGQIFVFRDGMHGEVRDTKITQNAIVRGMYTNRENAEAIEEITAFANEKRLSESEVLLYGKIPAMSYILNIPPAISTSWPDLNSYEYETMVLEMEELERKGSNPVILISSAVSAWITEDMETWQTLAEGQSDLDIEEWKADKKLMLMKKYMQTYKYTETFSNQKFAVYQSER